ncbi:hypothetical protein [Modestobacter altitudinis]|uniref:hypothetical protein n=1 Tax=Modestobacter altitudinis TaxID=2213158 RepID=UPI0014870776|nr:hypothetical protein [Modestobacter altitudinis]
MTTPSNYLMIRSYQADDTDWPRCETPGCSDRFMQHVDEDVDEHFRVAHPGVTPIPF